MPSAPRTPLPRLLLALGAACVLALLGAAPAAAHAALVSINPPDGGTLGAPPNQAELQFSEGIRAQFAVVTLTSTDGTHPTLPGPAVNGSTVTQTLPTLAPGLWTLAYRLLSEDGHPIQGTSRFTITAPPASNAAAPTAAASPQTPTPVVSTPIQNTAQPAQNGASTALSWTLVAIAALIAATGITVAVRRRTHPPNT